MSCSSETEAEVGGCDQGLPAGEHAPVLWRDIDLWRRFLGSLLKVRSRHLRDMVKARYATCASFRYSNGPLRKVHLSLVLSPARAMYILHGGLARGVSAYIQSYLGMKIWAASCRRLNVVYTQLARPLSLTGSKKHCRPVYCRIMKHGA